MMNISKIFPKNRQQLIESLELSRFLYDITIPFEIQCSKKYRTRKNRSIKFFFKVVSWWQNWEFDQIREQKQLLYDYPYWKSRQYYCQRIQKFISNELSIADFISQVLDPSLSNKSAGADLIEDFQRQASIELDPKSLGFSKVISGLIPVLEGFDEDPEESFFTEKEFREIIENVAIEIQKYPIE